MYLFVGTVLSWLLFVMHYYIVTIFPELFSSFLSTSLVAKAKEKWLLQFSFVNPRDFCLDTQKQVDDQIYGGGAGMLMKWQPIIDALRFITNSRTTPEERNIKVLLLKPSKTIFIQEYAHQLVNDYDAIVLVCGRYEGIDHRVELWCQQEFWQHFDTLSLGQYVTLGGEVPAMAVVEATARLVRGVIKEQQSRQDESYRPEHDWNTLEYPQYTRPETIEWFSVPEILLSGHHAQIEQRKISNRS